MELLVTMAFVLVLSTLGVMAFRGYVDTAKTSSATNQLKLISLAQFEYKSEFSSFYCDGSLTTNHASSLNSTLFNGNKTLDEDASVFRYQSLGIKPDGTTLTSDECSNTPSLASGFLLKATNVKTNESLCLRDDNTTDCG